MKTLVGGIAFIALVFAANLAGAVTILVVMTAFERSGLPEAHPIAVFVSGVLGVFMSLVVMACFTKWRN